MLNRSPKLPSSPLFSALVALCTLILLYFPSHFLRIILSPVLICTSILLLALLRLAEIQTTDNGDDLDAPRAALSGLKRQLTEASVDADCNSLPRGTAPECEKEVDFPLGSGHDPFHADCFVEWDVRAPLDAIHEEYEGDDEAKGTELRGIERYASLSLYYPETDSDSSSDGDFPLIGYWGSPESMSLVWEEDGGDGLIEIALDGKKNSELGFHVEEDNLIEIDLSPARKGQLAGDPP